jgi:DNA repair exonuclease SbcCD nuclease subunit
MTKKLFVTDTHLGLSKSSDLWHNITLNLFNDIRDYCIRNDINTIIHLGDFFHDRKSLNTKTQEIAHLIAKMFEGRKLYIIIGNHDTFYKNQLYPTTLEFLKSYSWITIVDEVIHVDELTLCPWGKIPQYQGSYCCGHFELSGFHMNNSYVCEHGTDPNTLKEFEHVYSGHFHTPSTKGNITYLGSAFPQSFHDVGSPRGYYEFEDGNLKFIEFTGSPKFIKCNTINYKDFDLKNNIVKVTFIEDYGNVENQKIIDEINSMEPLKLDVNFEKIVSEDNTKLELEVSDLPNHRDLISKFIDDVSKLPKNIDKKLLKSFVYKLMEDL